MDQDHLNLLMEKLKFPNFLSIQKFKIILYKALIAHLATIKTINV